MKSFLKELLRFAIAFGAGHLASISPLQEHSTAEPEVIDTLKHATSAQEALVYDYFSRYNPEVSSSTVLSFVSICDSYGLSNDEDIFLDCIHQICLESSAKQSARSPSGPMGIGQIAPTTAFDVLHKMSAQDQERMELLGIQSVQWARDGAYSYREIDGKQVPYIDNGLRGKAKKWLGNERNNLTLWAHMMHQRLNTMEPARAFLSYHLGTGGVMQFAGLEEEHAYIRMMDRIQPRKKKKGGDHRPS